MKNASYSFDDLVFEGRNKAYGAYELRQSTDRHNAYGFIITMSAFMLLVLAGSLMTSNTNATAILDPETTIVTPVDITPIIPPPPVVQPPSHPLVNTEAFKTMVPVASTTSVTETSVPTQEQLIDKVVSTETVVTTTPTTTIPVVETPNTTTPSVNTNTINKWAAVMPSFIGGEKALKEYLASHIKMHPVDIENGISGRLVVRFYVDTDGSIKDATVVQDLAGGHCAEIALAVINKMPKWNPGMQNNVPVKVYYTVPIKFEVK